MKKRRFLLTKEQVAEREAAEKAKEAKRVLTPTQRQATIGMTVRRIKDIFQEEMDKVEKEYIEGEIGYQSLAIKYGINIVDLGFYAAAHKWKNKHDKYWNIQTGTRRMNYLESRKVGLDMIKDVDDQVIDIKKEGGSDDEQRTTALEKSKRRRVELLRLRYRVMAGLGISYKDWIDYKRKPQDLVGESKQMLTDPTKSGNFLKLITAYEKITEMERREDGLHTGNTSLTNVQINNGSTEGKGRLKVKMFDFEDESEEQREAVKLLESTEIARPDPPAPEVESNDFDGLA